MSFVVSNEFPPYHHRDERGQWQGIVVDLAEMMIEEAGCRMELINVPWKRALEMLSKGEVTILPHITAMPEREPVMYYVGPMALEQIVFVSEKKYAQQVREPRDLLHFPALIGKNYGTEYTDTIELLTSHSALNARIVPTISDENKIEMLQLNRLGGIFEELAVAEYFFHEGVLDPERYQICLRFESNPVYFGVSRAVVDEAGISALRVAWRTMIKREQLKGAYQKYGIAMPALASEKYNQY